MKILLVAYDFPPVNRIAALRPYSFARYWIEAGHEVKVLTRGPRHRFAPVDSMDAFEGLDQIPQVEVSGVLPAVLKKWTAASKNHGREGGGSAHLGLGAAVRALFRTRRARMRVATLVACQWAWAAAKAGRALWTSWPFDVIVSTYGPWQCHVVGSWLKRRLRHNLLWVADYRDLWSKDYLFNRRGIMRSMDFRIEEAVMKSADLMVTVSSPLVASLCRQFPNKEVVLIENGFHFREGPSDGDTRISRAEGRVRLVYTGSLMLDGYRIDYLFDAVKRLKERTPGIDQRLEVVIYSEDALEVETRIASSQLGDVVRYGGFLGRRKVLCCQQDADGLIFLEWDIERDEGHLTGKLFEYMGSGTPIIAVGGDPGAEASRMIEENGFGVAMGRDVERLASLLEKMLNGEALPYHPNPAIFERYDRRNLALKLLDEIEATWTARAR